MPVRTTLLLCLATNALGTGKASAQHHEQIKMTPIKRGGQVVGAKFEMVLQPVNYTSVRLGLGKLLERQLRFRLHAQPLPCLNAQKAPLRAILWRCRRPRG